MIISDLKKKKLLLILKEFKKELFHIGSELNSAMVIDKIISLEYNGVVEGPDKFAIKKECCHWSLKLFFFDTKLKWEEIMKNQ